MNNEEILQKAIEKAEKLSSDNAKRVIKDFNLIGYGGKLSLEGKGYIFSHSFAKAFWGEENHKLESSYESTRCNMCGLVMLIDTNFCWQYHLQRMVLEENPLEYLAKFLKGK